MGVTDDMTEERWRGEAAVIGDGWEPSCVPVKGGDGPSFGWTKGSFGIFESNAETQAGLLELSSLTHLKTGMRVAIFSHPEHAAAAGELAERVGDWSELDEGGISNAPGWKEKYNAMCALWRQVGFVLTPLTIATGSGIWAAAEPVEKSGFS